MRMLTWIHVGDLHASDEDGYESLSHLSAVVDDVNVRMKHGVDFAFLPGDNANHATAEQYARIREVLEGMPLPLHAIPGDHDFEDGDLVAFYEGLGGETLPRRVTVNGRACLFLDVVSQGTGGPDFRLGETQQAWLANELTQARATGVAPLVFMHAYPGDLADEGEALGRMFAEAGVAFVDTGHTHYNELLNDGTVLYGATRSTGQIEEDEGTPGYTVVNVDEGVVSWRFCRLRDPRPFVMITQPADVRLVTDPASPQVVDPSGVVHVRAKVFGEDIRSVTAGVADGPMVAMSPVAGEACVWEARIHGPAIDTQVAVRVVATDRHGVVGDDAILAVTPTEAARRERQDAAPGSDAHAVEAWPAHGILGSQLGPNKHGRHW
ncbi:metallophosphoesterase [Xanthomonas sp. NCPPB 2632]|uniref:metallophosphoesterase family protein n=1 Tax=Xanthomonas sp. NCPPB 2632 TaxID=3240912 RepID=UPI003517A8BB